METECPECGGTGRQMEMKCYGGSPVEVTVDCSLCDGNGVVELEPTPSAGT